jgi:hypothetical protein
MTVGVICLCGFRKELTGAFYSGSDFLLELNKPARPYVLCPICTGAIIILSCDVSIYQYRHTLYHITLYHYTNDARSLIPLTHPLTTCTHTHPYEYTYANHTSMSISEGLSTGRSGDSRSHHWRLVVDGNVAYHLTHNARNSGINPGKGASTRI